MTGRRGRGLRLTKAEGKGMGAIRRAVEAAEGTDYSEVRAAIRAFLIADTEADS